MLYGNCSLVVEDTDTMLDWNEYRKQLAAGVKEVGQLSPDTIKGYVELSSAGQKTDLVGAKVRELIALAVAVTSRCDGCITVHAEAAIKHGATKEERLRKHSWLRLASMPGQRLSTPHALWMHSGNIHALPCGTNRIPSPICVGELGCFATCSGLGARRIVLLYSAACGWPCCSAL
jgi:AhpD family alkylhydroperoxidase